MHTLTSLHPLGDKGMSSVQHHPLRESEFGLTFWLEVHSSIIQLIEHISVIINCVFLRGCLFEDVLLRVEEDIEVGEVETLVN